MPRKLKLVFLTGFVSIAAVIMLIGYLWVVMK
jgi:hypothetical protein